MERIRYIRLHNSGAFVARIRIQCISMETGHSFEVEQDGYHDICAAAERTFDLQNDAKGAIKPGDLVTLEAVVVLGKNKTSEETYIYDPSSSKMATYTISGTTLINSLKFEGCN